MANVTDPLAAAIHGTDPQNLMEYITRQKIYDCRYWKEQCFGLTAADVLEKATALKCYGASYGGNAQPTKFLCLILKLLQIQPPQELVDTFLDTEDFKYVRALGAFYRRLTGRPAQIYETLEPLYTDYRKVRYRDITEWRLYRMDEFIHQLLTESRVCGISLPRLPARKTLVEEGYLEEDYKSPILQAMNNKSLEEYLYQKVLDGSPTAKALWEERETKRKAEEEENRRREDAIEAARRPRRQQHFGRDTWDDDRRDRRGDAPPRDSPREPKRARKEKKQKKDRKYGSLFKSSSSTSRKTEEEPMQTEESSGKVDENSEEYWNAERAKLGLKPLKK